MSPQFWLRLNEKSRVPPVQGKVKCLQVHDETLTKWPGDQSGTVQPYCAETRRQRKRPLSDDLLHLEWSDSFHWSARLFEEDAEPGGRLISDTRFWGEDGDSRGGMGNGGGGFKV